MRNLSIYARIRKPSARMFVVNKLMSWVNQRGECYHQKGSETHWKHRHWYLQINKSHIARCRRRWRNPGSTSIEFIVLPCFKVVNNFDKVPILISTFSIRLIARKSSTRTSVSRKCWFYFLQVVNVEEILLHLTGVDRHDLHVNSLWTPTIRSYNANFTSSYVLGTCRS